MSATLFDRYQEFLHAEYQLEQVICDTVGGEDWWKDGQPGLPFSDWYFDTYDRSVEMVDTQPGWEPAPEHLTAFAAAGICKVYVSYAGAAADEYGPTAARLWCLRGGAWQSGGCSARKADNDKRGLVRELLRRLNP